MNEMQISMLIAVIGSVAITAITVMVTKQNRSDIYELEHDLDRLKVRVGGDLMEINSKLRVIEQMEFIEKVKKICDEESFSYEILEHIEDGYAYIRIFTKELDTFFLSEISKICNYEIKERTNHLIRIRVSLKGE